MIGDWTNSIRAAMDNLIWLYRDKSVTDERRLRHIRFPVTADEHNWLSWRGLMYGGLLPDPLLDQLHQFQPHVSGIRALAMLERLWNDDKHRAPTVALTRPAAAELRLPPPYGLDDVSWTYGSLHEGDVVVRVANKPGPEPDFKGEFRFLPCFEKDGPGQGQPLFMALRSLHNYVVHEVFPKVEAIPKP